MKKVKFFILLLAAMPIIFLAGCKKDMKSASASTMRFNITDAPANFDALNIDVQAIKVHTTSGWVTLNSSLGVINILSYVNGSSTLAAQGEVTAGSVDQVQLILGSNNSVVVNGTTYPLLASGSLQTALTTNLSGQLQAGGTYVWTIDFDAAQSVTANGAGNFQLNPVIRLIVDSASLNATASGNGSGSINIGGSGSGSINVGGSTSGGGSVVISGNATGSITGSISPAGIASVCVTGPNGGSICTMTDLSGHFTLQAVSAGNYSLTITPVISIFGAHTIANVNVTGDATTNVGVVSM